jgi:hypothetical protein
MLTGFSCSGYGGSPLFRHGRTALPAYREHLPYRVTSTEQGKPVALPERGSEVARPIDGDAGMRPGRKRMLLRNGADTGCVSSIDNITGRESGQTSLRCFTRENRANRLMRQSR